MSKIRVIWKQGLAVYYGHRAIKQLTALVQGNYVKLPIVIGPQWKQAVVMEKQLRIAQMLSPDCQLLIYREPRQVSARNSRYKQALRTLGVEAPPTRPQQRRPAAVRPRPTPAHPKLKKPSRIVNLLQQELMRNAEEDF
jgi:hypothetical protein